MASNGAGAMGRQLPSIIFGGADGATFGTKAVLNARPTACGARVSNRQLQPGCLPLFHDCVPFHINGVSESAPLASAGIYLVLQKNSSPTVFPAPSASGEYPAP